MPQKVNYMSFWCISLTCLRWLVFVQDDIIINNVFNMEHLCCIFAMFPVRSIKNIYTVYNITLDKYQLGKERKYPGRRWSQNEVNKYLIFG
jgi:hypothetical protein